MRLANQIQEFRIPDHREAGEKNKVNYVTKAISPRDLYPPYAQAAQAQNVRSSV